MEKSGNPGINIPDPQHWWHARTCEDPRGRDIGIDPLQHLLQLDIRILADNGALRAQVGQALHGHGRHQAHNTRHVYLRGCMYYNGPAQKTFLLLKTMYW